MIANEHLQRASVRRVAQAIGELTFEGLLEARPLGDGWYAIPLDDRLHWRVRARPSAWGGLHVEQGSVLRVVDERAAPLDSMGQLILDARAVLQVEGAVLAEWLEEIQSSVLAEAGQCEQLAGRTAAELAQLHGVELEQHLDGHPKLVAHRGRVGWGLADLRDHAPEFGARTRLDWLVVAPELARTSGLAGSNRSRLLDETCSEQAKAELLASLEARAPSLAESGVLMPVHPWQLQRHVLAQYGSAMARGAIVPLGSFGDHHAARLSIRTLANVDRPERAELKLSLTILNTSCWRGLPGKHVERGVELAAALRALVESDARLREAGLRVLGDLGSVHVPQPEFESLAGAPYRLRELLGAIWRESGRSRLRAGEVEVPAAALQQTDLAGDPLVRHWIERSGATLEGWIEALFDRVVVPLDHLLCVHGIGVIAHGQNLGVILREGLPVGLFVRDVHGDVRRTNSREFEGPLAWLDALPPEHLVHDLYTGCFVGVLRFVAPLLELGFGLSESRFLALLVRSLRRARAERLDASAQFDLFPPTMPRICLNRARLRAGHGGGEQRPLPVLGPPLRNPLVMEDQRDE
jgi:aerobactin synthase